jgi:hypothetical protein
MARRLAASVRALLANWSLYSDEVVHMELMRTTVGFEVSTLSPESR